MNDIIKKITEDISKHPEDRKELERLYIEWKMKEGLVKAREEMELTRTQLAEKAGLTYDSVLRLESFNREVKLSSFLKYCKTVGITHFNLQTGECYKGEES